MFYKKPKTKKCVGCGIKFQTLNDLKKYCTEKCASKACFARWIKNNREHFNTMMREGARARNKILYYKRKELGLCPKCGKKKYGITFVCNKCRRYNNRYCRLWREAQKLG